MFVCNCVNHLYTTWPVLHTPGAIDSAFGRGQGGCITKKICVQSESFFIEHPECPLLPSYMTFLHTQYAAMFTVVVAGGKAAVLAQLSSNSPRIYCLSGTSFCGLLYNSSDVHGIVIESALGNCHQTFDHSGNKVHRGTTALPSTKTII